MPEVGVRGSITLQAGLDLGIIKAGVEGGLELGIDFNLHDIPDPFTGEVDGKIRVNELLINAQLGNNAGIHIFDVSGFIDVFAALFVKIDLFFFSFSERWEFLRIRLLEFEVPRPSEQLIDLADFGNGTLTLNVGDRADKRGHGITLDGAVGSDSPNESIKILPGTAGDRIVVSGFGYEFGFEGVERIVADFGDGNDTLIVHEDVTQEIFASGGTGNDQLFAGGGAVVFFGNAGNDLLVGGRFDDRLFGGDGNDEIEGNEGDDVIETGDGVNTVDAGSGDDVIIGGMLFDTIRAGRGNDFIDGGDGDDILRGEKGADIILGRGGDDDIQGGASKDTIIGGDGNDLIFGDDRPGVLTESEAESIGGSDTIFGGLGNDRIFGGGLNDRIEGGLGTDFIDGETGNDTLFGHASNDLTFLADVSAETGITVVELQGTDDRAPDVVFGGGGSDNITTGDGDDLIIAGVGDEASGTPSGEGEFNTHNIDAGAGDDIVYGDIGVDNIVSGPLDLTLYMPVDKDGVDLGSSAFDLGYTDKDQVFAGAGNDTIDSGDDDDLIIGGLGSEEIIAGWGNDVVYAGISTAGDGRDPILYATLTDTHTIFSDVTDARPIREFTVNEDHADQIYGDRGRDVITTGFGSDLVYAHAGDDDIFGEAQADTIYAGAGRDLVVGGTGDDALFGQEGGDLIFGGEQDLASDDIWVTETNRIPDATKLELPPNFDQANADPSFFTTPAIMPIVVSKQSLSGTVIDGKDMIDGGDGDDWIFGQGDIDDIDGGAGDDYIDGGAGNDNLQGGDGNDVVRGGGNDDSLQGGAGIDQLHGDAGRDLLFGDAGIDATIDLGGGVFRTVTLTEGQRLFGGAGIDFLHAYGDVALPIQILDPALFAVELGQATATATNIDGSAVFLTGFEIFGDELHGGSGGDFLYGNLRQEFLFGDGGNDFLSGDRLAGPLYGESNRQAEIGGIDELRGGSGEDQLLGGGGDDILWGGADTDWLEGQNNQDTLYGGSGIDLLILDTNPDFDVNPTFENFDGHFGNEEEGDVADDNATDILLIEGTLHNDTIRLQGKATDDDILRVEYITVNSLDPTDIFYERTAGGADGGYFEAKWKDGDNLLVEQFRVSGLLGQDTIEFADGTVTGEIALDLSPLNERSNDFVAVFDGGPGNDILRGTDGRDRLDGGRGSDVLIGLGGDDRLWGDGGTGIGSPADHDRLYAGQGNDDLIGGQGTNEMFAWSLDPDPVQTQLGFTDGQTAARDPSTNAATIVGGTPLRPDGRFFGDSVFTLIVDGVTHRFENPRRGHRRQPRRRQPGRGYLGQPAAARQSTGRRQRRALGSPFRRQ